MVQDSTCNVHGVIYKLDSKSCKMVGTMIQSKMDIRHMSFAVDVLASRCPSTQ